MKQKKTNEYGKPGKRLSNMYECDYNEMVSEYRCTSQIHGIIGSFYRAATIHRSLLPHKT